MTTFNVGSVQVTATQLIECNDCCFRASQSVAGNGPWYDGSNIVNGTTKTSTQFAGIGLIMNGVLVFPCPTSIQVQAAMIPINNQGQGQQQNIPSFTGGSNKVSNNGHKIKHTGLFLTFLALATLFV